MQEIMKIIILICAAFLLAACATQRSSENLTAADYNVQLGLAYLEKGDTTRAKEKLLRASEQAPDLIDTHLALGFYYEQIGQQLAAQQAYQRALKIKPTDGQVNNNYGAFLCAQGDYSQSMIYFQQAIDDPYYYQTAKAYENAALCSLKMNDNQAAARYADLAIQQDPARSDIFLKLSYLLAQQGDENNAKVYLERYQQTNS
jgi:type IV pilus assembly protein PilF